LRWNGEGKELEKTGKSRKQVKPGKGNVKTIGQGGVEVDYPKKERQGRGGEVESQKKRSARSRGGKKSALTYIKKRTAKNLWGGLATCLLEGQTTKRRGPRLFKIQ